MKKDKRKTDKMICNVKQLWCKKYLNLLYLPGLQATYKTTKSGIAKR